MSQRKNKQLKVGDLVKMDLLPLQGDEWGIGVVVEVSERHPDDVRVFWSQIGRSWEMKIMLSTLGINNLVKKALLENEK